MIIVMGILFTFLLIGLLFGKKNIINPMVQFNGIWLLTMILYALGLTFYDNTLTPNGIIAFTTMALGFNGTYLFFYYGKRIKIKGFSVTRTGKISNDKIVFVFKIWLLLNFFEAIYCKGVPLLWIMMGRGGSYATYGIPSVHGFINSLSWVIAMFAFVQLLNCKDKRKMFTILIVVNLVYIMLLARQSLVTEIIELFLIYCLKRRVEIKKIIVVVFFVIIGFGLLGNIRTGYQFFLQVSKFKYNIPYLLIGFLWVYIYIISPVGNINSLVNFHYPMYYGAAGLKTFLPSVIASRFFPNVQFLDDYLVNRTFNVSSFLYVPYLDGGMIGIFLFSGLLGIMGQSFWRLYIGDRKNDRAIMLYAVYTGIILLSFFSNLLLSLPIVIQFLYLYLFYKFSLITER